MPRVAISYRRADAAAMAGRMFDRLASKFGDESVFMDIDTIPYGTNYKDIIREAIGAVDVLLVVVGPRWLDKGDRGAPRLSEPDDVLRFEIETALEQGVPIVPVVVDGGKMPAVAELPTSIAEFTLRNAAELSSGRDFRVHMDRLIAAIETMPDRRKPAKKVEPAARTDRQYWLELGAYLVVAGIVLVILYFIVAMQFTAASTALYLAMTMAICGAVAALALRTHGLFEAAATLLAGMIASVTIGMAWSFQEHGNFAAQPFLAVPMANSVFGFIAANALAGTVGSLLAQARSPDKYRAGLLARTAPGRKTPLVVAAAIISAAAFYLAYVSWQPFCLAFVLADVCLPGDI